MRTVNPGMGQPAQPTWPTQAPAQSAPGWPGPGPQAPPRRSSAGCWWAGCGCLAVAAILVVVIVIVAGLGAALSSGGGQPPSSQGAPADPALEQQLVLLEQEFAAIDALRAQLAGNPVEPLVAWFEWYDRQVVAMSEPDVSEFSVRSLVSQLIPFREDLQQRIADAEVRRSNASGTLSEALVDAAGNGFIDIQWDAATACTADDREDWRTIGCVKKGDSLTVHLLPEQDFANEWALRMTVMHELAHVYQRADVARFRDGDGVYEDLIAQGLFQGNEEAMADCYALTYYGEWTLTTGDYSIGYGYVCDETERQAIRDWAADVGAPSSP